MLIYVKCRNMLIMCTHAHTHRHAQFICCALIIDDTMVMTADKGEWNGDDDMFMMMMVVILMVMVMMMNDLRSVSRRMKHLMRSLLPGDI